MIETTEQLYQAIKQMGRMKRILESYRDEILTKNRVTSACSPKARWSNSGSCNSRLTNIFSTWKLPD